MNISDEELQFKPLASLPKSNVANRRKLFKKEQSEDFIEKVENIPETFMKHVTLLGFQETDAAVLYKDKDSWMGASKGNVVQSASKSL